MPEFILTPEQIGEIDKHNDSIKHPALDIFGQPYDRLNASRKYLTLDGKRVFVVIPTGRDHADNTFKLAGAKAAPAPKGE